MKLSSNFFNTQPRAIAGAIFVLTLFDLMISILTYALAVLVSLQFIYIAKNSSLTTLALIFGSVLLIIRFFMYRWIILKAPPFGIIKKFGILVIVIAVVLIEAVIIKALKFPFPSILYLPITSIILILFIYQERIKKEGR